MNDWLDGKAGASDNPLHRSTCFVGRNVLVRSLRHEATLELLPRSDLPLPLRLLDRYAFLRRLPAALLGFGPRPERVRSPVAKS